MKKISVLLFSILLFLIPFSNVFASGNDYPPGLIFGKTPVGKPDVYQLTDGDNSTYINAYRGHNYEYEFNLGDAIDIHDFYVWISEIGLPDSQIDFIGVDGEIITTLYGDTDYTNGLTRLDSPIQNVYSVKMTNIRDINKYKSFEFYEKYPTDDVLPPDEVTNLKANEKDKSITLSWTLPENEDFSHVSIYQDGNIIARKIDGTSYDVNSLTNDQEYNFRITTVDEVGNESQGITISAIPTPPPDSDGDGIPDDEDAYPDDPENIPPPTNADELPEVKNLEIEATPERVDLSWKNPTRYFEKAKIYRRSTGQATASSFNLNPFAPITVQASEEFSPLFETNGTTFADLSVSEQESYEYKVTTVYDGMESQGVTVQTTVPKPPLVDTSDAKLPFDVGALIKSGNGLLGLIGGFVLLALAFIFVPKVIETIKQSFSGNKNGNSYQTADGKSARLTERQQKIATGQTREPRTGRVPRQGRI